MALCDKGLDGEGEGDMRKETAGKTMVSLTVRESLHSEQEGAMSYRGSSQSRAGTGGQPSPASSPRISLHGQQSRPQKGGGCL